MENLFENFVVELNHNQLHFLERFPSVTVSPSSSGVHIGSSNWFIDFTSEKHSKVSLLTNCCLEGEYRYPKALDLTSMVESDYLFVSNSTVVFNAMKSNQLAKETQGKQGKPVSYST